MASIPFALSVSHFVNSVGAKAGFAAIIGLALLVLLFFAQMRETAHLREQAEEAADHVRQLEQRLATLARGMTGSGRAAAPNETAAPTAGATVAPRPAAAGAAGASRAASPPYAPVGVGAPALASATRLIPGFDDGPISVRHSGAAAATANGGDDEGGRGGAAVMAPPGPPPATAAGGGNGTTNRPASPSPVGAGRPGLPPRPPATGSAPRGPRTPPPSRTNYGPEQPSRWRGLLVGLIALIVVAAIVVVLLLLTGGSSSPSSSTSSSQAISNAPGKHKRSTKRTATVKPSAVSLVVLNGTSTNQLAHDVSQKLAGDGYKVGTPATANDQTHATTIVGYRPGDKAAAEIVAKSLGLPPTAVSAVDQPSLQVACPGAGTCAAQVVVTVGADLDSVASSSSASSAPAAGATTTG